MAAAKVDGLENIILELYNITFADIKRYAGRKFNEKNFKELFIETFAVYTYSVIIRPPNSIQHLN